MYKGYYNIKNDEIIINPNLKGLSKLRWLFHEKIHQYLYKLLGIKIGRYINLLWDILDNEISLISFYCKSFRINGLENFGGGGNSNTTSHTFYYYSIKFNQNSIDSSQPIIFYDAYGNIVYTLAPNYEFMNYGEGILSVPGTEQNTVVESITTASYSVFYATNDLIIDYDKVEFHISKSIIRSLAETSVTATFEYLHTITPIRDIASVIDGRWDTQVQTVFYAQPPEGYNYAILDFGSAKNIQALDIVAGFFKPDDIRRFDIEFAFTLQSSLDNVTYESISDKTKNVSLTGGESKKFEESDLGVGFTTRYIKLILDDVKKIEYSTVKIQTTTTIDDKTVVAVQNLPFSQVKSTDIIISSGIYVVAITEIAAYNNIVLKSEATLIPFTELTSSVVLIDTIIYVEDTSEFTSSGTAYIEKINGELETFTYTGKTSTSFTGVSGLLTSHLTGALVTEEEESDTTLYDRNYLLPQLGDKLSKNNKVDDNLLYSQAQLDYLSKAYLKEYSKNHDKVSINVAYAPHIQIGATITLVDAYNNKNTRYFVSQITNNSGSYSLVLERFPADSV